MLALLGAQRPLTVRELVQRTRISAATVYRICANSPRILDLGTRPVQFYAKKYDELDAKNILIEYGRPKEGWLNWIEDANITLTDLLDINTNDTKKRLVRADALKALGVLFISLSNDLREGAGRPDWRNLLER